MKKVLVLGGTQLFGKRLVQNLLQRGTEVTIATRGLTPDPFGTNVHRLNLERQDRKSVEAALKQGEWDVVYDQTCYSPQEAADVSEVLQGRFGRYVFTSTMAVYPHGEKLSENLYDPYEDVYQLGKQRQEYVGVLGYQEAKRHTEAYLLQKASVPVAAVRFPIVIGPDDYTNRLRFYVDQVCGGRPIGVPDPNARLSFISSEEAAAFLHWAGESDWTGPINAASEGDVSHMDIMRRIEQLTGRTATFSVQQDTANPSPYAFPGSWTIDASKAVKLGFSFKKLDEYLPQLLQSYYEALSGESR